MKPIVHKILLLLLLGTATLSCMKESLDSSQGDGYLTLRLNSDLPAVQANRAPGAVEDLPYRVQIINSKGVVVEDYADQSLIPEQIKLKAGLYTIRATQGTELAAAFNHPFYVGEVTADVRPTESINKAITCHLGNVKVSVSFADIIVANFTTYRAAVTNEEGGTLVFDEGNTQSGYFKNTGKLTYTLTLINNQGTEFSYLKTLRNVEPREHHILSFDIDGSGNVNNGGSNPDITVDETLNDKHHNIEVILNKKPKPEISGDGFSIESIFNVVLSEQSACAVQIQAPASINRVEIAHSSDAMEALGIPRAFSLDDVDASTKAAIQAAGLTWSEPIADATTARLDFSALTQHLPLAETAFQISTTDAQTQQVTKTLTFSVSTDMIVLQTLEPSAWSKFAIFQGKWNTDTRPEELGFAFRKTGEEAWTTISEASLTIKENTFSVQQPLEANTSYQVQAFSAAYTTANIVSFTTDQPTQLPFMNFDTWNKSGKEWYSNLNQDGDNYWWDTSNKGANTIGEKNPTSPEDTYLAVTGEGKRAAKLKPVVVFGFFAAGSVYTGKYGRTIGTTGAEIYFGRPYTGRPTRLSGYYDYTPGIIDNAKSPHEGLKGQPDICTIYVILTDWSDWFTVNTSDKKFIDVANDPGIIAYGGLERNTATGGYTKFDIDIKYRSLTRKPTHVVLVVSSSKYGDMFTGSTGSTLYVDEFEFDFDAPVVMEPGY